MPTTISLLLRMLSLTLFQLLFFLDKPLPPTPRERHRAVVIAALQLFEIKHLGFQDSYVSEGKKKPACPTSMSAFHSWLHAGHSNSTSVSTEPS